MASTQNLTELPVIQYTGMDYTSVISQIQDIIDNNPNWKSNWTQFYNSEAGTMLVQLMAYICDNLAVRQDLLYNEHFLATAQSDSAKLRLLNQIGYSQKSISSAIVPIKIDFDEVPSSSTILLTGLSSGITAAEQLDTLVNDNNIFTISGRDINGASTTYQILSVNNDGTINYTTKVEINPALEVSTDTSGSQLKAVQGTTVLKTFTSDTSDGPVFELTDSNIDKKTIVVYDNTFAIHYKLDNFLEITNNDNESKVPNYIIETNDDGNYQIRYPSDAMIKFDEEYTLTETIESRKFDPVNRGTIYVLYRTCNGSDGNIGSNYLNSVETIDDTRAIVSNVLVGYNGEDQETLDDAVTAGPLNITTMNRAVTLKDYDRIFKNSDLVTQCKTISPYNEPSTFKSYYGRNINPQEVFELPILNKNINNISDENLNKYPWISTNYDHIIGEKYTFGGALFDNEQTAEKVYNPIYIRDLNYFVVTDTNTVDLSKSHDMYYSVNGEVGQQTCDQCRILGKAYLFAAIDEIKNEILSEAGNDNKPLIVKITTDKVDSEIEKIKNIPMDFFDDSNLQGECLSYSHNVISQEVHAEYTSVLDMTDYQNIDCVKYRYLQLVYDDVFKVNVDLTENAEEDIKTYYRYFAAAPTDIKEDEYAEDATKSAAQHRRNVIKVIQDAIQSALDKGIDSDSSKYSDYTTQISSDIKGTDGITNAGKTAWSNSDFKYAVKDSNGNWYCNEDDNYYNDYYNTVLSNGHTAHIRLGLNGNGSETYDLSNGPYTIQLNDEQYAINMTNAVALANAYLNTEDHPDLFQYIGVGEAVVKTQPTIAITETNTISSISADTENGTKYLYSKRSTAVDYNLSSGNIVASAMTINQIAFVLELVFSPYLSAKSNKTLYKYNGSGWELCDGFDVLGGQLRVRYIENDICFASDSYAEISDTQGAYDIEFDLFNGDKALTISNTGKEGTVGDTTYISLISSLLGYYKTYSYTPAAFDENYNITVSSEEVDEETVYTGITIASPTIGYFSRMYIMSDADKLNTITNIFGISNITSKHDKDTIYQCTDKAYGIKRIELFVGDNLTNKNIKIDGNEGIFESYPSDNTDVSREISVGDILVSDNNINNINSTLYISYRLTDSTSEQISGTKNIVYSEDEDVNNTYIENNGLVCIDGANIITNSDGYYAIDDNTSDYDVYISKTEPKDVSSAYSLTQVDSEGFVKTKLASITTNPIDFSSIVYSSTDEESNSAHKEGTSKYNEELRFKIDDEEVDIKINAGTLLTVNSLITLVRNKLEENENLADYANSIVKLAYDSEERITFTGINKNEGSIEFLTTSDDNLCKYLFKCDKASDLYTRLILSGTVEGIYTNGAFVPTEAYNIKVLYTTKIGTNFYKGTYYISEEPVEMVGDYSVYNNTFINGYTFYINKSKDDEFTDRPFYLSFVNNRAFEQKISDGVVKKPTTDEDLLNEYMEKYQITGTDVVYMKPLFKTFDIVGEVKYNANYDYKVVKANIEEALYSKFGRDNLTNIPIGNYVYTSDIYKTIVKVDGVDALSLTYFGYDCTDTENYPTKRNILNLDDSETSTDEPPFYLVSILAQTENSHGVRLTYTKSDAISY